MRLPSKLSRLLPLALVSILAGFLAYALYANIAAAQFTGPPCTVGNCSGAIGINSTNDLSFGTSTATSSAKVYIVTSTANNAYGLIVRGKIYSSTGGFVFPDGTLQTTASAGTATTSAANVTPGYFNSTAGTGGNYSFPASLSIATSTAPSGGVLYVNGNVGIGTTTPTQVLAVSGSNPHILVSPSSGSGFVDIDSVNGYSLLRFQDNGAARWKIENDGSNDDLQFEEDDVNVRMVIQEGGNVGIGTTTPTAKLAVAADASASGLTAGQLHLQGLTDGRKRLVLGYNTTDNYGWIEAGIQGSAFGNLALVPNGGNVGIGTTTPASPLTVAGAIRTTTGGVIFPDGTTQTSAASAAGSATTTAANVSAGYFGSGVGSTGNYSFPANLSVGTSSSIGRLQVQGLSSSVTASFRGSGTESSILQFCTAVECNYVGVDNATSGLTLGGTFDAVGGYNPTVTIKGNGGNVGIGVTDPGYALELKAGGVLGFRSSIGSGYESLISQSASSPYDILTINSKGGTGTWRGAINFDTSFNAGSTFTAMTIRANTDGTTANVGIGTTTPASLLHLSPASGNALVTVNSAASNGQSGVTFAAAGTTKWDFIKNTDNTVRLYDYVGSRAVIIANPNGALALMPTTGSVGIGTSTPTALFAVGTSTTGLVATFGAGSGKINVGTIDPVYTIGGKRYATYLPGMTGQKEETTGVLSFRDCHPEPGEGSRCSSTIDFKDLEQGSDLWLFGKAVNLEKDQKHFEAMTVLLTPAFDGKAWYEKDIATRTLTLYAQPTHYDLRTTHSPELSYRLTAPRFDAAQWTNYSKDQDEGFNLDKLIK